MPDTTENSRCGIYIRVSTEQQVDRNSLSTQETQLRDYAKLRGWEVAKVFTDAGLSAKDTRRPALQAMFKAAKAGKLDVVLVSKVDRISRNLIDLLNLIDDLNDWDVDFVAASQNFDTSTPVGRLSLNMVGSFAQFEREMIAERVRENMHERAKDGVWSGGVPPFGYGADEATKRLVPDASEAEVVRAIFASFLASGSVRHTIHAMNAEGRFNRDGKHWARTSIGRILRNPVYIGTMQYARREMKGSRIVDRDPEDWVVVENAHPAIIERDDFERAQRALARNSRPGSWKDSSPHLLTGLGRCASCGSRITGITCKRKTKAGVVTHGYYRCVGRIQKGKSFCEGVSYHTADLDAAVASRITGFDADELARQIEEHQGRLARETGTLARRLSELAGHQDDLRKRELKLLELYEQDAIDLALYKERRCRLEKEKLELAAQQAGIEAKVPVSSLGEIDAGALVAKFSDLQGTFDHLKLNEKQRLLQALVHEITVHADGRVEVELNLLEGLAGLATPSGEQDVVEQVA